MRFEEICGHAQKLAEKTRTPGVQLAVWHRGSFHEYALGTEEQGTGRALTVDSAVPTGSITKIFTAALALALVADDDLDPDAPVAEHLDVLRRAPAPVREVTARHLLGHTSGLVCEPPGDVAHSPVRYAEAVCAAGLVHPPGTGFSYSNAGYSLLGALATEITGMTWWEAVEAVVLKPLGIAPRFTVAPVAGGPSTPGVRGHSVAPDGSRVRPVDQALGIAQAPAGGLACSAGDLVRFGRMLLPGDEHASAVLDAAGVAAMRTPVPGAGPFGLAHAWGLGLARYDHDDLAWWGHDGMANGTSCHLRVHPESGVVVALTTNGTSGHALWRALLPHLREQELPVGDHEPPTPDAAPTSPQAGLEGAYLNGDTAYQVIERGTGLFLGIDAEPEIRILPHSGGLFSLCDPVTGHPVQTGRFLADDRGRVDRLQIAGRSARRHS